MAGRLQSLQRMAHQAVHAGWRTLLSALHTADLALGLFPATLSPRLGPSAERPPEPWALTQLLERYYRGDGDVDTALARLRQDRVVLHREGDRATARQIVARLRLAAPELGPLGLIEETEGELVLRTSGAQEPLAKELLEDERFEMNGEKYTRRTVTVRALVAATNVLLARRGITRRFVPIAVCEAAECYVAIAPADALVLDASGLLDEPLDEVRALARWNEGPLVVFDPARRVA